MREVLITQRTNKNKNFVINGVCCLHGVNDLMNQHTVEIQLEQCMREAEHYFCNTFMFILQDVASVCYGEWISKFKSSTSQLIALIPYLNFYHDKKEQTRYQKLLHQCDQVICMQTEFLDKKNEDHYDYDGNKLIAYGDWHILIHHQQDSIINQRLNRLRKILTVDIQEIIID